MCGLCECYARAVESVGAEEGKITVEGSLLSLASLIYKGRRTEGEGERLGL